MQEACLTTTRAGAVAALGALATLCNPLAAEGQANPWRHWNELRLKARAAPFLSGHVEMRLGHESGRTLLETQTQARLLGISVARSRTRSLIDAETGRTEDYVSLSPKRGRHYRFTEQGYTVEKLRPQNGFDAPLDQWTVTSSESYLNPGADDDGGAIPILDYYGMLLHLRDVDLQNTGDEVTLWVATSKGPRSYVVRLGEKRQKDRTVYDENIGKKRTIPTSEFRLTITPAGPDPSDEGFLGMKGETEVWVEAETKFPLVISGKVPGAGRVVLEVSRLRTAPTGP